MFAREAARVQLFLTVPGRSHKPRAGGAQLERPLAELGWDLTGLAPVVLPIALFWAALSLLLGRAQSRLADRKTHRST